MAAEPPPEGNPQESAEPAMRDIVGSTIDERYILEDVLGEGGMGVVFKANQTSIHRPVALKMLHPSLASAPEFYERFRREAELVSKLRHPNIIAIHDFGQTKSGACYYVMELVEGESLRQKVRREGPMSLERTVRITEQIARALGHAHQAGIIHRDLKPHNVMCTMVDNKDFIKVLDFGLVKSITQEPTNEGEEGLTTAGQVLGTPQYMAPEQAAGEHLDPRADLYALGVCSYVMLTGVTPYGQKTVHGALKAAATQPLPSISSKRPDAPLPDSVEQFFKRAMAYDRDQRPPSAEAFIEELQAVVAKVPKIVMDRRPARAAGSEGSGSATSRTVVYRDPRTGRRVALGVIAACLLGAGGWGGWKVFHKPPGQDNGTQVGILVPAPPPVPPPPSEVEVEFEYSTEKKRWIEHEVAEFSKAHPDIQVKLVGRGSLDAAELLVAGKDKPVLWSPADSLALNLAASNWDQKNTNPLFAREGTDDAPQSLVLTPLVILIWGDRAKVLEKHTRGEITWKVLHDAVASEKGWKALGGKPDWGQVKLGHTDPTRSNSGLQTLFLMTLDHFDRPTHLTVDQLKDPTFKTWLQEMERGQGKFEASTGTFITDLVRFGPSRYDIGVAYESLAIDEVENAAKRWGALQVLYPSPTCWSDHPIALLQGPWVSEPQKKAARELVKFLRSRPAQEQALVYGFRPADPDVPVKTDDPKNPFTRLAGSGIRIEIPGAAAPPEGPVVREMLDAWSRAMATH
jgi:ABC-type Fe3+ transport system substrate-binding protein